jgi:hypothetical protein
MTMRGKPTTPQRGTGANQMNLKYGPFAQVEVKEVLDCIQGHCARLKEFDELELLEDRHLGRIAMTELEFFDCLSELTQLKDRRKLA